MSEKKQEIQTALVNAISQMESCWQESGTITLVRDTGHAVLYINNEFARLIDTEPEKLIGPSAGSSFPAFLQKLLSEREKSVQSGGKPVVFDEKLAFENAEASYSTVYFPIKNTAGEVIGTGLVGIPAKNRMAHDDNETDSKQDNNPDIDPLTEIPIHQALAGAFKHEITQSGNSGKPLSIVLINVDNLARINEESGKAAGDIVLVKFCELVKNHLRSSDLFGRWEDTEFILVLPDTNVVAAAQIAERIRHAIENYQFLKVPSLTACFGVALHERGETILDCVSRADAAKMNGKNRVEVDRAGMSDLSLPDLKASNFLRLVWKREYECGNTIIDYQHRLMVSDANRLLAAMLENAPKKQITPLINKLLAHIQQHFDEEESILEKMGYRETEEHAMIHRQLIAKAVRLSVRFEENKLDFSEIFNFLASDVVIEHMLKTDRKYFPFLPQARH